MTEATGTVLPVRPRRQVDEWSETYLVDAARANGLARPWRNHVELVRATLAKVQWGAVPAVSQAALLRDGSPLYGGLPIPPRSRIGRAGFIRYCPECFAEASYVRSRWRLVGYHLCGVHACLIKDDLVEPAYTASYKTSGKTYYGDATTSTLFEGAACALPREVAIHRKIWGAFERLDRAEGQASTTTASALAWALLLQRLIDVVSGTARGGVCDETVGEAVARRGAWAYQYCPEIEPSWGGFVSMLDAIPTVRGRRNVRRVLARYVAAEASEASVLSLLPLKDLLARVECATPELGGVAKAWSVSLVGVKSKCLSIHEASLELGIAETRFVSYVREGGIEPAHVVRTGQRLHQYFTRDQILALKRHLMSLVAVEDLIESQGLSWPGYFSLRRAGYLSPRIEGGRRYVTRSQVGALMTRLEDRSSPATEARRPLIALFGDEVFSPGVPQEVSKGLVDHVLSGSIPLFRDLSESGFAAFKVCDTIAVHRDQLRVANRASRRLDAAVARGQLELFA
jgi:hypothetical protein